MGDGAAAQAPCNTLALVLSVQQLDQGLWALGPSTAITDYRLAMGWTPLLPKSLGSVCCVQ